MKKTPQITEIPRTAGDLTEQAVSDPAAALPPADDADESAIEIRPDNEEKLAAMRHAIAKGDYDSDAILEKALQLMLKALEGSKTEQ